MRRNTLVALLGALSIVFLGGFAAEKIFAKQDSFYEDIIRFENIIRTLKVQYVEDVPVESLMVYGINGMRDILDPHTTYFEEKENKDFRIHMKGEFGGLGISIGMPDKQLTVIAPLPMPNSPAMKAGLMAGDRIMKINKTSTKGMSIDQAVDSMRGEKGTLVRLTISRDGILDPFEVELERDKIIIKSVPYFGMVDEKEKIGYINLTGFTEKTTQDIQGAVDTLLKMGIKGCILDLRNNGGGILTEAVVVSSAFLPENKMVVFTKGRTPDSKQPFYTRGKAFLPPSIPLVVLVNQGSASASEIVAGAIQDHDRGVIMGNETFGKGSVQSIINLDNNRSLKLTTAFYYTPSGRCINKLKNDVGSRRHMMDMDEDGEMVTADSAKDSVAAKKPKGEAFKTLGVGRTVYSGNGVSPDIEVTPERMPAIEVEIVRKSQFFKYAIAEINKMKAKDPSYNPATFKVTDQVFDDFVAFLKKNKFDYETPEMKMLKEYRKTLRYGRQDLKDTSKVLPGLYDNDVDKTVLMLDSLMVKERDYAFVRFKDALKNRLELAFLGALPDQRPYYRHYLKDDNYVLEAVKLLSDRKRYDAVLSPSFQKTK